MTPYPLTMAQRRALALARRTPLYRTPSGWTCQGAMRVQHQTIRALIRLGLIETVNGASLHTHVTPAGHQAAATN